MKRQKWRRVLSWILTLTMIFSQFAGTSNTLVVRAEDEHDLIVAKNGDSKFIIECNRAGHTNENCAILGNPPSLTIVADDVVYDGQPKSEQLEIKNGFNEYLEQLHVEKITESNNMRKRSYNTMKLGPSTPWSQVLKDGSVYIQVNPCATYTASTKEKNT